MFLRLNCGDGFLLTLCPLLVFSITYVPAEYLEEYKASVEQTAEDVFSEAAPPPRWGL